MNALSESAQLPDYIANTYIVNNTIKHSHISNKNNNHLQSIIYKHYLQTLLQTLFQIKISPQKPMVIHTLKNNVPRLHSTRPFLKKIRQLFSTQLTTYRKSTVTTISTIIRYLQKISNTFSVL